MDSVGVKWPLFGVACALFWGLWLWLPWPEDVSHGFALLVFIAFLWLTETLHVTLTALLVPIGAVVLQILTLPQALSISWRFRPGGGPAPSTARHLSGATHDSPGGWSA